MAKRRLPYFEVYKDKAGEWRWRLKAANHEILASGEGYSSRSKCIDGIVTMGRAIIDIIKEAKP